MEFQVLPQARVSPLDCYCNGGILTCGCFVGRDSCACNDGRECTVRDICVEKCHTLWCVAKSIDLPFGG